MTVKHKGKNYGIVKSKYCDLINGVINYEVEY